MSWHGICKGAVRKFILQFWNQLLDIYTNMDNYFIHSYILIRRRFKVYWYITQISYLGGDTHFNILQTESLQIFCMDLKKIRKHITKLKHCVHWIWNSNSLSIMRSTIHMQAAIKQIVKITKHFLHSFFEQNYTRNAPSILVFTTYLNYLLPIKVNYECDNSGCKTSAA